MHLPKHSADKKMYPTHWLHEVHSWGEGIRRVEVFDFNETHIYFVNGSGFKQSRLKKHVKRLEPLDWLPINGHDLYQQAIVVKQLLEAYQTASEVQELRVRSQHLLNKLEDIKYDHWAMSAHDVLLENLMWYPGKSSVQAKS